MLTGLLAVNAQNGNGDVVKNAQNQARSVLSMLHSFLPDWLNQLQIFGVTLTQWLEMVAILVMAYLLGFVLKSLILAVSHAIVKRTNVAWDDDFVALLPGPLRWFLTLLIVGQSIEVIDLPSEAYGFFSSLVACALVGVLIWFLLRALKFGTKITEAYFTKGQEGTTQARAIHTQVSVVHTVLRFLFIVLGVALGLLQFEVARSIGVSLLASVSVAGIAIGFAARSLVATIFAGVQIAFTQVIKIGDVVVVEGEWGTIEEIKLTYVVVKIWDLRRLILPVTYFTEKPVENWTATSTKILGTVYLYTDYTVPLDGIRSEVDRVLENEGKELWDGEAKGVIITDLTPQAAQVRVLVSAKNSSDIWNLRCLLREKLLAWLQTRGKSHLPMVRLETQGTQAEDGK